MNPILEREGQDTWHMEGRLSENSKRDRGTPGREMMFQSQCRLHKHFEKEMCTSVSEERGICLPMGGVVCR